MGVFAMKYEFLIETYATERIKVVSAWSMFRDERDRRRRAAAAQRRSPIGIHETG
jgi:hypothetical protein